MLSETLGMEGSYVIATFVALLFGIVLFLFMLIISVWIYMSFAYMSLARKLKYNYPAISWIPWIGPAIIAFHSKKKHHWAPWLFLILIPFPILNIVGLIGFMVFFTYWNWNLFEAVHKPGWWSLFIVIPGANVVFLALLGVAAWSKK